MQTIKSIKLFVIALVVCSSVFAQTNVYKPFPQVYGSWIVQKQGPLGPGLTAMYSWKKYTVYGDTVVGSYTYKKVSVADNIGYPSFPNPVPFGVSTFSFAYRNDIAAKKVYYLDVTGGVNKDTLWYDFNLNIGDTLKNTYSFGNQNGTSVTLRSVVSSIDSVLICSTYFKRFNFNCNSSFETQLIEGVGFLDKFIKTDYLDCPFEPLYIYHTDFSTCDLANIHEKVNNIDVRLYPNPTQTFLKISSSSIHFSYSIVNAYGVLLLKGVYDDEINISSLASGLYTIQIDDEAGRNHQAKFVKQ